MTGRFQIDLLHPGRVARTWKDWFVGPQGRRRLGISALACLVVLVVGVVALILPTYWRLSESLSAIPKLQQDLRAREGEINVLRADLRALALEAKRQVRWAEVMMALSQQIPPTLRLVKVEPVSAPGAPPAPPGAAPPPPEAQLRLEAVTPLRVGSPPLLEIAQFMAGLMKDPAVGKRFQLRSWEVKPPSGGAPQPGGPDEQRTLQVVITIAERAQ